MELFSLQSRIRTWLGSKFVRHVGMLVGGTGLSQLVLILSLPLLTRLYSAEDFSLLAVYTSLLTTLSVVACLRYDVAIPLPRSSVKAANLLGVALLCSASVCLAAAAVVVVFGGNIAALLKSPALEPYLLWLVFSVWIASSYSAIQYWLVRKQRFGVIATTRVKRSFASSGIQVGFGVLGWTPLGLFVGQAVSFGGGIRALVSSVLQHDRTQLGTMRATRMWHAAKAYKRFPIFSTFEAFSRTASVQLPILLIAALAAGPEAGFVLLASRALSTPVRLLGDSINQVYFSRAPSKLRDGRLPDFTASVIDGLARVGVGPLLFIGMVAPNVFPIVFGSEWARAGTIVSWMTPGFLVQLLSSPVQSILHVTNNQFKALVLQTVGLLIRIGFVVAAALYAHDHIPEAYALSGFAFYTVYLFTGLALSGLSVGTIVTAFFNARLPILMWCVLGLLVRSLT